MYVFAEMLASPGTRVPSSSLSLWCQVPHPKSVSRVACPTPLRFGTQEWNPKTQTSHPAAHLCHCPAPHGQPATAIACTIFKVSGQIKIPRISPTGSAHHWYTSTCLETGEQQGWAPRDSTTGLGQMDQSRTRSPKSVPKTSKSSPSQVASGT